GLARHQYPKYRPAAPPASQGITGYMTTRCCETPGVSRMAIHHGPGFPEAGRRELVASTQSADTSSQAQGRSRNRRPQIIITSPSAESVIKPQYNALPSLGGGAEIRLRLTLAGLSRRCRIR